MASGMVAAKKLNHIGSRVYNILMKSIVCVFYFRAVADLVRAHVCPFAGNNLKMKMHTVGYIRVPSRYRICTYKISLLSAFTSRALVIPSFCTRPSIA